jgi:hypothetical protein
VPSAFQTLLFHPKSSHFLIFTKANSGKCFMDQSKNQVANYKALQKVSYYHSGV